MAWFSSGLNLASSQSLPATHPLEKVSLQIDSQYWVVGRSNPSHQLFWSPVQSKRLEVLIVPGSWNGSVVGRHPISIDASVGTPVKCAGSGIDSFVLERRRNVASRLHDVNLPRSWPVAIDAIVGPGREKWSK